MKPKSKRILSERVGTVVARGDAALGLQQVSELLPIQGIDYVGAAAGRSAARHGVLGRHLDHGARARGGASS